MRHPNGHEILLQNARRLKQKLLQRIFGPSIQANMQSTPSVVPPFRNILGVGYGAKVTAGAAGGDEFAVRVYVRAKLPKSGLAKSEIVPPTIDDIPTDVIPVGDIKAVARPTACGVSIGHFNITAGTLGCIVQKKSPRSVDRYILSNNHVLADSNNCHKNDDVYEPGSADGGTTAIANLEDWVPIDFAANGVNRMDAAIAKVIKVTDVTANILTIGNVSPRIMQPSLYQSVRKHGRTTLHTVGVIVDVSADIWVRYGLKRAWFEDQIAIVGAGATFSAGGDSGSLIVDAVTRRPVALLFAGGMGQTFANPVGAILRRFKVVIV